VRRRLRRRQSQDAPADVARADSLRYSLEGYPIETFGPKRKKSYRDEREEGQKASYAKNTARDRKGLFNALFASLMWGAEREGVNARG